LQKLPQGSDGKRLSKGEVLVLAEEHIRKLKKEEETLEEENRGLEECVESLKEK